MTWILPPRSETNLLQLEINENRLEPFLEYGFRYMPGDLFGPIGFLTAKMLIDGGLKQ